MSTISVFTIKSSSQEDQSLYTLSETEDMDLEENLTQNGENLISKERISVGSLRKRVLEKQETTDGTGQIVDMPSAREINKLLQRFNRLKCSEDMSSSSMPEISCNDAFIDYIYHRDEVEAPTRQVADVAKKFVPRYKLY